MKLLVVTGLLSISAPALIAQATLGSAAVSGTVRDASGGALPAAKVVLTETARELSHETVTNEAGLFSFPSLPTGIYSLRVSREAFEVYELKDIRIEVGQLATFDVTMKLGQVSTVVSVSAEQRLLLETESNAIGTVVDSERVESLPLNGRNFLQLAMVAGVSPPTGRSDVLSGQIGHPARGVIIAGNMSFTSGYSINGVATRGGRLGESALNLSIASIDQFKLQQSFFMPDQGPNPGLVNVTTRGGTNQFRGQAFEFVRNKALDARNFFAPAAEDLKRNQFGFALGGPLVKDRLWFYANYEGLREITAFSARAYAPTAAMFGGDLREATEQIYDPGTFSADTGRRLPFAGNFIPENRFNPVSKNLLKYYLPGGSLSQRPSNVFANPRNRLDDDQYGIRVDAAVSAQQRVFGQFIHQESPAVQPGVFPLTGALYPNEAHFAMLQHTWTLRPALVSTSRVGFTRNLALFGNEGQTAGHILRDIGIVNTKDDRGVTSVGIQGFTGFGRASGDLGNIDNNYQFDEGINYVRGTHNFQFGAGIRYRRTWQQNANAGAHGNLTFQPVFTAQLARNAQGQLAPQAGSGHSLADFLLGMPTITSVAGLAMLPYRFTQYMPYFQDTWKLTRDLTLNYGVSWFLATTPEPQGFARNLPHGFSETTGLLTYAALGEIDPRVLSNDYNNFTPRLGLAWRPSFLPKTVIRSGVGIYFSDSGLIEMQFAMVAPPFNTPTQAINSQFDPITFYQLGKNIFPAEALPPLDKNFAASLPSATTAFLLKEDGRTPYVSQWNFSIQHSFSNNDLVELAYLGSSAHRLQNRYDAGQCRPGADLRCTPASKPWPRYAGLLRADFNGNSSYNALLAKYNHRVAHGLNFRFEYTVAKALTDSWESSSSTDSQITICRRCDKGPAAFDARHRATLSAIYDLPFGRGRRLAGRMPQGADMLLGGWMVMGMTTFSTGSSVFVTAPNSTGSIYVSHRPNRICDGRDSNLANNLRNNGVQFQTSCFVAPAAGFFGNSGRNVLYGPGINNWDVGIGKNFRVHEEIRLEFRAEMFNAFNHTQFLQPNADVGAGMNFGRVASARAPRLIQLGMKALW